MERSEEDRESLDALFDKIELLSSDRKDDQRVLSTDSEVRVNIYDMIGINSYISYLGIGAFHSGVEVYGKEYAYGGHPYSYTGVYNMAPRHQESINPQGGVCFRQSLRMGYTSLSLTEVVDLVQALGMEYNGNVYHIFHKNCNHFASELCYKLCGKHIPHWVNRLAYISSWVPFVIKCLPPSWITPGNPSEEEQEREGEGESKRATFPYFYSISQSKFPGLEPNSTDSEERNANRSSSE